MRAQLQASLGITESYKGNQLSYFNGYYNSHDTSPSMV